MYSHGITQLLRLGLLALLLLCGCRETATIRSDPAQCPPSASASVGVIPFTLPSAAAVVAMPPASGAPVAAPVMLVVDLDAQGALTVDGKAATFADLPKLAAAATARTPGVRALIRADSACKHGDVIRAIDGLKQGGIKDFGFAVVVAKPSSP